MIKLNRCCNTDTLTKVKEIYHSNSDEFILHQCNRCQKFWLYRKLEEAWKNNILLQEDEYEVWYIGITKEDVEKACSLDFDAIVMTHGYLYISTTDSVKRSCWRKIRE